MNKTINEEKYKKIAEELWRILDSIDTLPDMLHPSNSEGHEKTWKMMVKRAEKRHQFLKDSPKPTRIERIRNALNEMKKAQANGDLNADEVRGGFSISPSQKIGQ